jgi:hypothetical protein
METGESVEHIHADMPVFVDTGGIELGPKVARCAGENYPDGTRLTQRRSRGCRPLGIDTVG